jgi:hypothetical protein
MSITLNTVVFNQDTFVSGDKVLYTSANNTFSSKDRLTLARTAPKASTSFAGVARAEAKRTKTVTLADGSQADAIVTFSVSFPVGMAKVTADALRDDIGDFAISAAAETLCWNHDLTY